MDIVHLGLAVVGVSFGIFLYLFANFRVLTKFCDDPHRISQQGIVGKDGKWRPYSGNLTYVIDEHGNIIVGKRNGRGFDGPATPHPTLIGEKNPKVKMAGILKVENGKIVKYDNQSGHFKPNEKSMKEADKAFGKLSKNLFKKGE